MLEMLSGGHHDQTSARVLGKILHGSCQSKTGLTCTRGGYRKKVNALFESQGIERLGLPRPQTNPRGSQRGVTAHDHHPLASSRVS